MTKAISQHLLINTHISGHYGYNIIIFLQPYLSWGLVYIFSPDCSVLFPCDCLAFYIVCYYMLVPSTHSMFLCPCCLEYVIVQFKYHVKCLELFKIRRYIKCPSLSLLLIIWKIKKDHSLITTSCQWKAIYLNRPKVCFHNTIDHFTPIFTGILRILPRHFRVSSSTEWRH